MRGFAPLFQENRDPTKGLVLWKPVLKQGFGDQSPRPSVKMPARLGPAASAAFDAMECVIIKGGGYNMSSGIVWQGQPALAMAGNISRNSGIYIIGDIFCGAIFSITFCSYIRISGKMFIKCRSCVAFGLEQYIFAFVLAV